jgi:hypothetical protein
VRHGYVAAIAGDPDCAIPPGSIPPWAEAPASAPVDFGAGFGRISILIESGEFTIAITSSHCSGASPCVTMPVGVTLCRASESMTSCRP